MGCVSSTLTYRTRDSLERGCLFCFICISSFIAQSDQCLYGSKAWTCTSILGTYSLVWVHLMDLYEHRYAGIGISVAGKE